MEDINQEYKFMVRNHLNRWKALSTTPKRWMLDMIQARFYEGELTRPAEFRIDDFDLVEQMFGRIETLEHDFVVGCCYGLLIHERHKPFFRTIKQKDIVLHPAIIIGERENDEDSIFEGYYLIPQPHRPLNWIDTEKSIVLLKEGGIKHGEADPEKVKKLESLELKQSLANIPLEKRMFFDIVDAKETSAHSYMTDPLIHNSIAEYIAKHDSTEQILFLTTEQVQEDPGILFN